MHRGLRREFEGGNPKKTYGRGWEGTLKFCAKAAAGPGGVVSRSLRIRHHCSTTGSPRTKSTMVDVVVPGPNTA